jgi:hypothetical protein
MSSLLQEHLSEEDLHATTEGRSTGSSKIGPAAILLHQQLKHASSQPFQLNNYKNTAT